MTGLGHRVRSAGTFWYDFVIGDDWRCALAVLLALAVCGLLAHAWGVNPWWLLPVALFSALGWSLRAAVARRP